MSFENTFLKPSETERPRENFEAAMLNREAGGEGSSEKKKKMRNLFLAISIFAGSFAGNLMLEKNASAGEKDTDEKISAGFSYNQNDLIKKLECDEEIRREMSPTRPYNQEDLIRNLKEKEAAKEMAPTRPYNQQELIRSLDQKESERKQELYQRALAGIKNELQREANYSGIKDSFLRRSAEENYKTKQLGMKVIADNPEKATVKMIDQNTIVISVAYENPETGLSHHYDHIYQIIEKK